MVGTTPTCPYLDRDCPKVSEVQEEMDRMRGLLQNMTRILYVIVGIILVQTGVLIV